MTTIGNQSRPAYVYDSETDTWVPIGVGPHTHDEYIDKTIITTKGDIVVGTATEAVARLGVGAEGSVLIADPTSPTGLAWGEAGGSITVSETAPEEPGEGDLWFNSTNATTYIYYDGFWIEQSPAVAGPRGEPGVIVQTVPPTETDALWLDSDETGVQAIPAGGTAGQILTKATNSDYDAQWLNVPSANAIINGAFDFWQRGTTFTNPASDTYVSDRFKQYTGGTGATRIFTRETFPLGAAPVAGVEGQFFLRMNQTVAGTGDTFNQIHQRIEDVRTFAGQTVTISFYAKAASAITITPNLEQVFGSGGSTAVNTPAAACSITTSWQRFTRTVSVPSISGRTIGANSALALALLMPNNATFTFDVWGVQVEAGTVATPFRRAANTLQGELAACQRYCVVYGGNRVYERASLGATSTTAAANFSLVLPVEMRAVPTLAVSNVAHWQIVLLGLVGIAATGITLSSDESGTKIVALNTTFSSNANFGSHKSVVLVGNNTLDAKIILSAEL
jgi:hypothetical protein